MKSRHIVMERKPKEKHKDYWEKAVRELPAPERNRKPGWGAILATVAHAPQTAKS